VTIYRQDGSGFGGLTQLTCDRAPVGQPISTGQTYYVQIGGISTDTGPIDVKLELVDPAPNDMFAQAIVVTSIPFSDSQDGVIASVEAGEPLGPCYSASSGSVWYRYTPANAATLSAGVGNFDTKVEVYTGTSLATLSPVVGSCAYQNSPVVFSATGGTTYYFRVMRHAFRSTLQFELKPG
jgi:hypothetical protein